MNKILTLILFGLIYSSGIAPAGAEEDKLYTAHNLWYEFDRAGNLKPINGINYKRGNMIPAGTEVKGVLVNAERRGTTAIDFELAEEGKKFVIHVQAKYHPGVDGEAFRNRTFTSRPLTFITKGFTEAEMKHIGRGTVAVGMRKEAVIVSYGYPPEHRTESIKSGEWLYWMDRFRTMKLVFNEKGIVVAE